MKKLLTFAAAASALAVAAPAAAQWSNDRYANVNARGAVAIDNRIDQLEARFRTGVQQGLISRQEANMIRPQLRNLKRLERQYSRNGLTQQERSILQQRIRDTRRQLRMADGGRFDRDTRYGSWNESYWNDGGYAQGGPYEPVEEVCERRSGIGGVISSLLGRDDCDGLRVGQRVSGSLYGVPYQYRNHYRDGNGIYYRSDGRQIYQIDARTNTILRVYDMR